MLQFIVVKDVKGFEMTQAPKALQQLAESKSEVLQLSAKLVEGLPRAGWSKPRGLLDLRLAPLASRISWQRPIVPWRLTYGRVLSG